jgi:3-isopropylmalate dehydratase small subunit
VHPVRIKRLKKKILCPTLTDNGIEIIIGRSFASPFTCDIFKNTVIILWTLSG